MDNKSLGKCPFCDGDIVEREKNFACSKAKWEKNDGGQWENKGCQYSIYKFALQKFGKEEITADEVKELLDNGHATVELKSKKQITVDEKFGVKLDFNKQA